jgi:hypothetical protein
MEKNKKEIIKSMYKVCYLLIMENGETLYWSNSCPTCSFHKEWQSNINSAIKYNIYHFAKLKYLKLKKVLPDANIKILKKTIKTDYVILKEI